MTVQDAQLMVVFLRRQLYKDDQHAYPPCQMDVLRRSADGRRCDGLEPCLLSGSRASSSREASFEKEALPIV
jgi:hypothetical protein